MKTAWLPNITIAIALAGIAFSLYQRDYMETLGALALLVVSAVSKVLRNLLAKDIANENG